MKISGKIVFLALLALFVARGAAPVSAQIVLVDNQYYVTELRPGKQEFGVAINRGEYTRNWVHVRRDTRISIRRWLGSGRGFRDDVIAPDRFWNYVRLGTRVRVVGGRDWDGSVAAKRIWL